MVKSSEKKIFGVTSSSLSKEKSPLKAKSLSKSKSVSKEKSISKSKSASTNKDFLSDKKWSDKEFNVNPLILKSLSDKKFEFMTKIQAETYLLGSKGKDILAKGKTGSGKTLAFLSIIESSIKDDSLNTIIITPNKDLAIQTATEAEELFKYTNIKIQVVIGGLSETTQKNKLLNEKCNILIGTCGRLKALLDYPDVLQKCKNISMVVLDEADQLLDSGNIIDLNKILKNLNPPDKRQTLLFSATLSDEIKKLAGDFMKKDYSIIDTVGDQEVQTNLDVTQNYIVTNEDSILETLEQILIDELDKEPNLKAFIFLPSIHITALIAYLFNKYSSLITRTSILEYHGGLNQNQRIKEIEKLKTEKSALIFSTDAGARGHDIKNIQLVIQIGYSDSTTYTHRIGRTGRAGHKGHAVSILMTPEKDEMLKALALKNIPITEMKVANNKNSHLSKEFLIKSLTPDEIKLMGRSYSSLLGSYSAIKKKLKWTDEALVNTINNIFKGFGLKELPAIKKKTFGKLHLKGNLDLKIE